MTIIEINAREDGSRNIQSRHGAARVWEDGYIEVPVHLEAAVWATYGWCDLQIEEGALVGITPTERPPEPEPEPSPLDRLGLLEEALAQTDETAIALFESQAEQASINAQQDDALLDIYEMLGG
ncbi:hypothetical protein [Flavonifractor plautii]|mgnify:FL=1|jgi:hypothetical protein|uniref:Uncharacterized protein n=1 Tax=Flavonifractor plautii TaxID=292800 RepID=A0AAW6CNB4_FLAPL|nr:hypothetical protein [Flavonifractor plautii]MDB7931291.1 hypothetical protein [Flavonifractor plautii]MDB7936241.1 hypothetical protein [Flavonifractor plautii]MDB7941239.1 hypothetical protein [Flavonifractor plautii]DAI10270.1 MAG TPA: hypothetical protein [Caudoviricetes sp.]